MIKLNLSKTIAIFSVDVFGNSAKVLVQFSRNSCTYTQNTQVLVKKVKENKKLLFE